MVISEKMTNIYRIYCCLDEIMDARKFAEKYVIRGSAVETRRTRNPLLSEYLCVTEFESDENDAIVHKAFLETFNNYDTRIIRRSMFILREVGFV